jgi:hypothetical protein
MAPAVVAAKAADALGGVKAKEPKPAKASAWLGDRARMTEPSDK